MTLVRGSQRGPTAGLRRGLNPLSGLNWPTTGAELAAAMGYASSPTSMWRGDEVSGATDLVAGNDLADSGTPNHSVSDAALGTVTTFDSSTDALSASALDVTTNSIACLFVGRIDTLAGTLGLIGKRAGSPFPGYEITTTAVPSIRWSVSDGSATDTEDIARDYAGEVVFALGYQDIGNNEVGLLTDGDGGPQASVPSTVSATLTKTNASAFAIGKTTLRSAFDGAFALGAVWVGAAAEGGFTATHLANLKNHLGL